jgi:hypothetical protein
LPSANGPNQYPPNLLRSRKTLRISDRVAIDSTLNIIGLTGPSHNSRALRAGHAKLRGRSSPENAGSASVSEWGLERLFHRPGRAWIDCALESRRPVPGKLPSDLHLQDQICLLNWTSINHFGGLYGIEDREYPEIRKENQPKTVWTFLTSEVCSVNHSCICHASFPSERKACSGIQPILCTPEEVCRVQAATVCNRFIGYRSARQMFEAPENVDKRAFHFWINEQRICDFCSCAPPARVGKVPNVVVRKEQRLRDCRLMSERSATEAME